MKKHPALRRTGPRPINIILLAALLATGSAQLGQAQLVADNFNRANNSTVGNGWTEFETVAPTSVRIESNQLRMSGAAVGRDIVSKATPGTYDTRLANNGSIMEWAFNMQVSNANPTGFSNGNVGIAVVLAGSHADLRAGQGYAVAVGTPGSSVNPLRLVRYNGGLANNANLTNLVTVGNFGAKHLDVRVTYTPATGTWALYYTDRGAGPFGDPLTASTLAGSVVNNTYTGTNLPFIGCLFNHGTSSANVGRFDNFHVPQDNSTSVSFTTASGNVAGSAGSHNLLVEVENPNPSAAMTVDMVLVSGDAARVGGFTSQTLHFPAGTTGPLAVVVPIVEDGGCNGDEALVFGLDNFTGGTGTPYIHPHQQYGLTILDNGLSAMTLVSESFETNGAGSRYQLNATHGGTGGTYFLRTDNVGFIAAGGPSITGMHGSRAMGGCSMAPFAPDAEVIVTFPAIDILDVTNISVGLKAAARNAAVYDNLGTQTDYIFVEARVDGGGWATLGAFRSMALPGGSNKRIALDTDLDGVGDGTILTEAMRTFNFPVALSGAIMDLRVRMRSNAHSNEDLFFDDVRLNGDRCQPIYFSTSSGDASGPVWSTLRNGAPTTAAFRKNTSLVVQGGHTITTTADMEARNVMVESGGALDLGGNTLTVSGTTVINNGLIAAPRGGLRLVGMEGAMTLGGDGLYELFDLLMDNAAGATIGSPIDIHGTISLANGAFNATTADVRLRSTSSGTGRLGPVAATASYLGHLTMERHIPAGATNWRLLGSPVAGATVEDWKRDFFTAGFPGSHYPNFNSGGRPWPSIRWYDETNPGDFDTDGLVGVTGTSQSLAMGQGFAAWSGDGLTTTQAFTIGVTGAPYIAHSPITLPMTWTGTGNPLVDGLNLVSNPLPSAISFSQIARGADVQNFYWVYNPANGNNATWNGVVGTNGANGTIQSSQGFWLKTNGPALVTTISESAKTANNGGGLFGGQLAAPPPMVRIAVEDPRNGFSDEAVVVFQGGSPGFDAGDVEKFGFGHPDAPRINSRSTDGHQLAINMHGTPEAPIAIPLVVKVPSAGDFTLRATDLGTLAGLSCLMLEDLATGARTTLAEGTAIHFTIAANDTAPRFVLHGTVPVEQHLTAATCHGTANGKAAFTNPAGPTSFSLMDAFGNVLVGREGTTAEFDGLAAGNYLVGVASNAGCGALTSAFTIMEPMPLEAEVDVVPATCATGEGSVAPTVLGGTAPYSFAWSNGANDERLSAAAGTYTLSVTDANGCRWTSEALTIAPAPMPVAAFGWGETRVLVDTPARFESTSTRAESHLWDLGDGTISTDRTPLHTYALPGRYTVTLTVENNGCTAQAVRILDVQAATGIERVRRDDLNIWSDGASFIVEHGFNDGQPLMIEVLDATGRLHAQRNAPGVPGRITIPAEGLNPGVWFVRLTSGGTVQHSQRVPLVR